MKSACISSTGQTFPIGKVIGIGRNYAEHAREMKSEVPSAPIFFLKPATSIVADGGTVVLPPISSEVHHEVELTVLIGKDGKDIPAAAALGHVAGYGVGLDLTLRDVQAEAKKLGLPWALAKGFDTSGPLSDFVPASSVPDPGNLRVELLVNGEPRQQGETKSLLTSVPALIAYVSRFMTLEAGDVIFTGTPEGVARIDRGDSLEGRLLDSRGTTLVTVRVGVA